MTAIVLSLVLAAGPPCTAIVDRTPTCTSPAVLTSAIAPDPKRLQEPGWDPGIPAPAKPDRLSSGMALAEPTASLLDTLPAELGLVSAGLALGGGAGLVLGLATTSNNDDERLAQDVAVYTGLGMLAWSTLVGAGAVALAAFDPSSGELRWQIFPDHE